MDEVRDPIGFMSLLISHFPVKHRSPEAETLWMQSFYRHLKPFTQPILEKAANDIVLAVGKRPVKDRRFPTLAECIKACADAKRWLDGDKLPAQESAPVFAYPEWTPDRKAWADKLALNPKDPICLRAAKEGWTGRLHDFVRNHNRMPTEKEIPTVKRESAEARKTYEGLLKQIADLEAMDMSAATLTSIRHHEDNLVRLRQLEALGAAVLGKGLKRADWVLGVRP